MDILAAPESWRFPFALSGLVLWLALESWRPFRVPIQNRLKHSVIDLAMAGGNVLMLMLLFGGFLLAWSHEVTQSQLGLFNLLGLSLMANAAASIIVLDLLFYAVHRANHSLAVLWRFHRAHHSDLDLDVTTASRFHPGEVFISTMIKVAAIWAFGVSVIGLVGFEIGLLAAAQFQHSNLRIPEPYETTLRWIFVTPNMHRIHHSIVPREHNSNFSTIFSLWDRLMGTYHMNVRQEKIGIGLTEYQDVQAVTLLRILWMPFTARCIPPDIQERSGMTSPTT